MIQCLDGAGGWRRTGSLWFNPSKTEIVAVSWATHLGRLTEPGTDGRLTAARHAEREPVGSGMDFCPAPSGAVASSIFAMQGWQRRVRVCVRVCVCVLFWLSSPQDWGYDCLESGHVFLKSHPGSGLHHHQPQLSVGFGEVHGAGVTSGAVNALTRGCPRDPPHACVLMFPVLQATAGTALLWRGVLWVTPRLSQQTPSQRAPDWDFCNAQLSPGLWEGFTPDCFRSVLVPTIYLPLDV